MKYDIIVIGGGLGGLTAGAKLAKEGHKVLLLEQHDRPGGCATTFRRHDYTMEVGLHEMDGLHPADPKTKIFRDLGIFDRVEFLPLPEFYRYVKGAIDIVIPHDPEEAKTVLKRSFPGQEEGIDKYFDTILNARKVTKEMEGVPDRTIGEFLDEIITDDNLKLVLLGNLGYFHDDPYSLSFLYYINAQGSYYQGRANYIKGGSQKLSDALVDIIRENGGTVRLNCLATNIFYEDGRPSGVSSSDISGRERKNYSDTAGEIIINAAIPSLATTLLPPDQGRKLYSKIEGIKIGASLITVYYGFKKPLKAIGNKHYSTFVFHPSVTSQVDILRNNHCSFEIRSFTLVDYSQVDSALSPAGTGVGAVCMVDYPADWEGLDKEEYKNKKAWVAEVITRRCNELIPGFSDAVGYVEVATSLTVERYTLNPRGAVYGFAQVPGKDTGYTNSLPDNLHIASAWGKFGGGFSGAIISGYMTAFNILRKKRV